MENLLAGIYSKTTGSDLSTSVGGRIYLDYAPKDAVFPYVVFFIVNSSQDRTFSEHYTNTYIQFSIWSTSSGVAEISAIYGYLRALYDEESLTITDSTLVWMREMNLLTSVEERVTLTDKKFIKHWSVDFEIYTSLD